MNLLKRSNIWIRDPFIYVSQEEQKYYLFGTTGAGQFKKGEGFVCYASKDLENWEKPKLAFSQSEGFWGDTNYWAPEVYKYKDKFYMFASFKSELRARATQPLISDKVSGPYMPLAEVPPTPLAWECLDGTLFIDEEKKPWMVFCHEWLQVKDGEICTMRLADDLKTAADIPFILFKATDAGWPREVALERGKGNYVTDGPFLYRTKNNSLLMLWSSFAENNKYAIGLARSETGKITGPWKHEKTPLFADDGGHGMIFKTLDNRLLLSIHAPNSRGERAVFLELSDEGDSLKVISKKPF